MILLPVRLPVPFEIAALSDEMATLTELPAGEPVPEMIIGALAGIVRRPVMVAVGAEVVVTERAALTFAIIVLLAPNEERSERIPWTCELVRFEGAKFVVGTVPPYRIVFTFAIATLLAPNEERIERID